MSHEIQASPGHENLKWRRPLHVLNLIYLFSYYKIFLIHIYMLIDNKILNFILKILLNFKKFLKY